MNEIVKQSLPQYREIFGTLHDGIVLKLKTYYVAYSRANIDMTVLYIDPNHKRTIETSHGRAKLVNIEFSFGDVVWTNLCVHPYNPGLDIMRADIDIIDNLVHFDFWGSPERFDYVNEPNKVMSKNSSALYIIAQRAFWEIKPPTLLPLERPSVDE